MRSPMPRAALLLLTALTLAAPAAAADVFTRLDAVATRVFARTRAASPDAAGLMDAAEPSVTLMSVDESAMAAFRAAGGGRLAIPAEDGATVELELEPYTLLAKGVSVTYTDDLGRHEYRPDLTLYRGHVAGDENSWAVVSMGEAGLFGAVEQGARRWTLSPAQPVAAGTRGTGVHAFAPEGSLAATARRFVCGVTDENAAELGLRTLPAAPDGRMATPNSAQLNGVRFEINLAVDCDYELYGNKFGSNLASVTAYVQTVLGTVNLIYERDLETTMPIVYLHFWTTTNDPYTATTTNAQLPEFRAYWLANNGAISSHVEHLISGRGLGGGIAYLDAVCSGNGFGVSAIDAVYSYPTFTSTWDINVIAHELGHNFGSPHTHSCTWAAEGRVPSGTLDSCETPEGSCATYSPHLPPNKGTIMSYCHLISGVANGIRLEFHTVCVSRMRALLSGCGNFPTPAPPRNPIATTIPAGVRLTWTNGPSSGVLRYSIYRSRFPLDLGSGYLGSSLTSPFDSDGFGTYYYRIRSIRASDSSATSGEVKGIACAFANAPTVAVGSQPTAALSADFNEDGIPDVALVTTGGGNLVTLLGQGAGGVGNGSFAAPVSVATGTMPVCLAVLDANGDGILDAVVGGQEEPNALYLHLGQGTAGVGNGTFGAVSLLASLGFAPSGLIAADVNEDGIDDLITAGDFSSVSLLLGQGTAGVPNGTFAAPVSVPTGGLTRNVIGGDWNGDGIPDLAVSGIGVRLLYGNGTGGRGNGTFTQGANVATGPVPNHMATGDFDMDGVTDLAVCNTSSNTVSVLLGNGTPGAPDGTFAAAISAASGSGPNTVAVADFDHDGRPDLVVATNTGTPGTSVMLGRGDGTFETAQLFTTGGNGTSSIAVNDFNEDGTPDLLACNRTSLNVTRQLAGCAATLSSAITVTVPNGGESWIGATEHTLTWTKGPGVMKVNVQLSTDGGTNWRTVASGLTGTSFAWTATGPYTTHARIRVVDSHADQFADASNADFELVDESTLAVGDEVPRLALLGAWPNPAREDLTVSFALPTGASGGTIELIDLAGRRVASRDLAEFSAGRHQVTLLERRAVTPGVYLLRLTRGQDVRSMKVAVVR